MCPWTQLSSLQTHASANMAQGNRLALTDPNVGVLKAVEQAALVSVLQHS